MLFTSSDQTLFGCPSHVSLPLHFRWRPRVTCFDPHHTFGWMDPKSHASPLHFWMNDPPSHMLLPPHFWMNGPPSHMLLPHTLDENGLQVTCFSSTLWMNGTPSHMLLPHTFGWMDHQVTCFFPTLWMNGSLVQPFAKMLNHPTMSPVGIYLLQQVG